MRFTVASLGTHALVAVLLASTACKDKSANASAATKSDIASPSASAPPASAATPADACAPLSIEAAPAPVTIGDDPAVPAIDDEARSLDHFYEAWARRLRGGAKDHVRIAVYGDSNGTRDFTTGEMRRILQTKYGDAGHGFIALIKPWNWYLHQHVKHDFWLNAWDAYAVTTKPTLDLYDKDVTGYYGHALIVAESKGAGAVTWVATADEKSPVGKTVSRVEISYLKRPNAGTFDIKVDGKVTAHVDTAAPDVGVGFERLDLPDAPHKIEVVSTSGRKVRVMGATLERSEEPSFVVDSLGVGSLNCLTMLRDHPITNAATLKRRNYDLVVFHIGSNTFTAKEVAPCMKKLIERHRAALPNASFMIMSPPDYLESHHPPRSTSWILNVVKEQRVIAKDNATAFFDFHGAMGGEGSMGRFQEKDMAGDWVHFNDKGGAYMGSRVVYALWDGFARWLKDHPRAGCQ